MLQVHIVVWKTSIWDPYFERYVSQNPPRRLLFTQYPCQSCCTKFDY